MSPANRLLDGRSGWSSDEGPGRKVWGKTGEAPILVPSFARVTWPQNGGTTTLTWTHNGNNPPGGDFPVPRYGLIDYAPGALPPNTGLVINGHGSVDVYAHITFDGVVACGPSGSPPTALSNIGLLIKQNGVLVGSNYLFRDCSAVCGWAGSVTASINGLTVNNGDLLTAEVDFFCWVLGPTVPAGVGVAQDILQAQGNLLA